MRTPSQSTNAMVALVIASTRMNRFSEIHTGSTVAGLSLDVEASQHSSRSRCGSVVEKERGNQ